MTAGVPFPSNPIPVGRDCGEDCRGCKARDRWSEGWAAADSWWRERLTSEGVGFPVSDLTPEETLRASRWFALAETVVTDEARAEREEVVHLSDALAAVAAERERQLGAREGDTTGSNE